MTVFEKIAAYFSSTREEVRKVSWPTRQDTIRYSALVVGLSILVAVFFAGLDYGFSQLVDVAARQRSASQAAQTQQPNPVTPDLTPTTSTPENPTLNLQGLTTSTPKTK